MNDRGDSCVYEADHRQSRNLARVQHRMALVTLYAEEFLDSFFAYGAVCAEVLGE